MFVLAAGGLRLFGFVVTARGSMLVVLILEAIHETWSGKQFKGHKQILIGVPREQYHISFGASDEILTTTIR